METKDIGTWFLVIMSAELVAEAIISAVKNSYYNYRVNEEKILALKLKAKKKKRKKKFKKLPLKLVSKDVA